MSETRATEQVFPFSGGVMADPDTTKRPWEDMENLVPISGKSGNLTPREGMQQTGFATPVGSGPNYSIMASDESLTKRIAVLYDFTAKTFLGVAIYVDEINNDTFIDYQDPNLAEAGL